MELKENQIAALFMGAMLDYDKELQRIATLKAELLRKEAAAKKFRTCFRPRLLCTVTFCANVGALFVLDCT